MKVKWKADLKVDLMAALKAGLKVEKMDVMDLQKDVYLAGKKVGYWVAY